LGENARRERLDFYILAGQTKNVLYIWRFSTKFKKRIDKKLWGWYAENTAMLKSGYLLMSLEKGVTVAGLLRSFCIEGRDRPYWVDREETR